MFSRASEHTQRKLHVEPLFQFRTAVGLQLGYPVHEVICDVSHQAQVNYTHCAAVRYSWDSKKEVWNRRSCSRWMFARSWMLRRRTLASPDIQEPVVWITGIIGKFCQISYIKINWPSGVVVITSVLHTEGPGFDPLLGHIFLGVFFVFLKNCCQDDCTLHACMQTSQQGKNRPFAAQALLLVALWQFCIRTSG